MFYSGVVNLLISNTLSLYAAVLPSVMTTFYRGIRVIMSKGIKPFQVKHLFSEVMCSVKGQGVLKHVKMLITLSPHTLLEAGKKDTLGLLARFGFGSKT